MAKERDELETLRRLLAEATVIAENNNMIGTVEALTVTARLSEHEIQAKGWR